MPLYQVDVQICGTAYVRAKNKKEAKQLARKLANDTFEFSGEGISGRQYNDPQLPGASLSPAFTGYGIWPGAKIEEV